MLRTSTATATRTLSGPQVLRPKQLKALLNAPDRRTRRGRRDAALIAVLGCGGLRLGECVRLTVEGIELGKRVRITTKTAKSRTARSRTITLPGPAARLLRDHLAHSEPRLFVFEGRRHEALSTRQAGRIVTSYLRKIGRGDLHPHSLRHGVGAMITRATGSIFCAQSVLGHASPTTTARFYACWAVEDADKAADAIEASMK